MKHLLFLLIPLVFTTNAQSTLQSLDKIIVVVNTDVITQHELNTTTNEYKNKLNLSDLSAEDNTVLTRQVLEKMIRTKIQLQHAEKLGITIDDVSLNRVLEKIAESNNLSLKELSKAIESEGLAFSSFREQTRSDLIIKQLQERMVARKINVTDQEIQHFIKTNNADNQTDTRYHLSHILISTPETAKPEDINNAKKNAEKLFGKLLQGSDFADTALRHSNGRNALKGGDLGWRQANELPIDFISAIKNLKDGEIARPIRSASGFHILKINKSSRKKQQIEQTHARHILIRTGATTSAEQAQKTLTKIKQQIKTGGDFSELARKHSQDPGSKDNGGDLGWANPGTFVTTFEEEMGSLKIGQISEPFSSQFGWHIIQVLDRRKKDKSNDILEAQARKVIHKRKTEEELRLWLRRIHDESYIEYKTSNLIP